MQCWGSGASITKRNHNVVGVMSSNPLVPEHSKSRTFCPPCRGVTLLCEFSDRMVGVSTNIFD